MLAVRRVLALISFRRNPSKLDVANGNLRDREGALEKLSAEVEVTKNGLPGLQTRHITAAVELAESKERQKHQFQQRFELQSEIELLQQQCDECRQKLSSVAAQRSGVLEETIKVRQKLEFAQKMHGLLVYSSGQRMHKLAIRESVDGDVPRSPADGSEQVTAVAGMPLVVLAGEAAEMESEEHASLQARIRAEEDMIVGMEHERQTFDKARTNDAAELERLKSECTVAAEQRAGIVRPLSDVGDEVQRLREHVRAAKASIDAATRARDELAKKNAETIHDLASKRSDREDLKAWTWKELERARSEYSEASKIRQRIVIEQESNQKELVQLATAHSSRIASGSGGLMLGTEGAGGLMDATSPDARVALVKASTGVQRPPTTPRLGSSGVGLSATPRGVPLRGVGQRVLGSLT